MNKKQYTPPIITKRIIELEQGLASASVTPHIQTDGLVTEEWEEEDVIFEKVEW